MTAGKSRFTPELNEDHDVIELLDDLSNILGTFLTKQFIPLTLVGFEMIIANSALCALLAIYHLISNALME